MLKTVTEQKPTNVIIFPSKTILSMYDDFKTRKKIKKKKQKNGADHHIVRQRQKPTKATDVVLLPSKNKIYVQWFKKAEGKYAKETKKAEPIIT